MAQQFLDQLPMVRSGELPKGAECMICQEEYGMVLSDNGVLEHPVLLPCLHHVGSECIATWLSPEGGPGNSCPMCRTVFFPAQIREYDDEDDGDDDDEDDDEESDYNDEDESEAWNRGDDGEEGDGPERSEDESISMDGRAQTPMTILAVFQRLASRTINTPTHEELEERDGQEWFERWPLLTSQQIEDSEIRARQALLRPPPSGSMHRSPPEAYSPPADLESRVAELASAYRTMAFRETLLYLDLMKAGARMPPLELHYRALSAQHEEVLLWEMGQRGAFSAAQVIPGHMAMTNRESWYVHRMKGEVYNYEQSPTHRRAYWATDLRLKIDVE